MLSRYRHDQNSISRARYASTRVITCDSFRLSAFAGVYYTPSAAWRLHRLRPDSSTSAPIK